MEKDFEKMETLLEAVKQGEIAKEQMENDVNFKRYRELMAKGEQADRQLKLMLGKPIKEDITLRYEKSSSCDTYKNLKPLFNEEDLAKYLLTCPDGATQANVANHFGIELPRQKSSLYATFKRIMDETTRIMSYRLKSNSGIGAGPLAYKLKNYYETPIYATEPVPERSEDES